MNLHDSMGLISPEYRRSHGHRAFTMIELVIVVLIVGILAAAAAPKYSQALDGAYTRAAAERVKGDLKYARRFARQSSKEVKVSFDLATNSYTLEGIKNRDHRGRDYTVVLSSKEFNAEIYSVDFNDETCVTFNIYGHADRDGEVTVRSGSHVKTIKIDAYGQVSLQQPE